MEFLGYGRPDGSVGVRNHIIVIAPMDCSFEPARKIAEETGVIAVTQHHGCGYDPMVASTLIGAGRNPNVAGVLVLGLGCESITADIIADGIQSTGKPVEQLLIQEEGGSVRASIKAKGILLEMSRMAAGLKRESFPLEMLTMAVECGGSDATSGLAANPAVGVASDMLVDAGGTVIFGETQEMVGAQHVLARRAVNPDVAAAVIGMIGQQESRMKALGVDGRFMSKGNMAGGLSTIEEKSLGAITKGGSHPIQGVLELNRERFDQPGGPGLWLQNNTGMDVPSITSMVAAGAQVVVFTTGRGSTTGHAIAPVVKVTGNPDTFKNLEDNMDVNAGLILNGGEALTSVGERIFKTVMDVASGRLTKAERLGYRDFIVYRSSPLAERLMGFECDVGSEFLEPS
jgi:altronate dehydratase large subunit